MLSLFLSVSLERKAVKLKLDYGVHLKDAIAFVNSDESARRFLAAYERRTYTEYARALALFFNWLKKEKGITITPTAMLNMHMEKYKSNRIEERTWAKNLAIEFCRDNPDFNGHSDTHMRLHWNVIKLFFDSNEAPLCYAKKPLGRKVARRKYHPKPISREHAKRILVALNLRERTIALVMIQSGMGIGEVLNKFNFMLDYVKEKIRSGSQRIRIDFPNGRKNNTNPYFTFIGKDAIQQLRLFLTEREKWIREENLTLSPEAQKAIFISRNGKLMNEAKFERNFSKQLYKSGAKTEAYEVVSHQLRKLFKTESSIGRGIDSRVVEFMLGHINGIQSLAGIGGTYDNSSEIYAQTIEEEYSKLEPYLNILSGKATEEQGENEAIQELKTQNQQLSIEIHEINKQLKDGLLSDNCVGGLLDELRKSMREEIMKELKMKKKMGE